MAGIGRSNRATTGLIRRASSLKDRSDRRCRFQDRTSCPILVGASLLIVGSNDRNKFPYQRIGTMAHRLHLVQPRRVPPQRPGRLLHRHRLRRGQHRLEDLPVNPPSASAPSPASQSGGRAS